MKTTLGAVETALELLDLFERTQSLRVTDVSRALGISSSSAHRLLLTFSQHGYVTQERSYGAYVIGSKLADLAATVAVRAEIVAATRTPLLRVAEELGETVCVGILRGTTVSFVAAIDSRRAGAPAMPNDMTLAAHASAAGKALIADYSRSELEQLFPGETLPRITSKTLPSRESLVRDLERTRSRGYAVHVEESRPHFIAYACPIRDLAGAPRAALVVVGPTRRFHRDADARVITALHEAVGLASPLAPSR